MAGRTGLEPATSCVTGRYSNQLNYRPSWYFIISTANVFKTQVGICEAHLACYG
jgi:hypothetical protein